jgi:hypothetical protein
VIKTGFDFKLSLVLSAANPLSYRISFTTGLIYPPTNKVTMNLIEGGSPLEINAYGYLVEYPIPD